jgi:L-ascorbate metabolism protein UlaG (beta-lactamase superfamily)
MDLTKYAHACVTFDKDGGRLLVDPGAFATNTAELLAGAGTVLITHEHFDHFDEEAVTAALRARPELKVYGPAAVVTRWLPDLSDQVTAVAEGDLFTADGFEIAVYGGQHAPIHDDIPRVANVGYLIEERVYHPGDSYYVPQAPVQTLLLPTSGPWTKLGEAVDFVRSVRPEQVIQIHETMLSEVGQRSAAMFISPKMLTQVELTIVPAGETISA